MSDIIQRIKHILYRKKNWLFNKSWFFVQIKKGIWKLPKVGSVIISYRKRNDISYYFNWNKLEDGLAKEKLQNFTLRYAKEPDIIFEVQGEMIIEPEYGLAIDKGRRFIPQSGTLSHIFLKPNFLKYLKHKYLSKKYTSFDRLVHCDGFAGINLCHFIYDTVNPILFLNEKGMITEKDPILIGEKVYNKPYFKYLKETTFLGRLNWVVQKQDEWIKVKRFEKAFVSMEIFKSTYKLLDGAKNPHRKIFLNRKSYYQRNIKNINALTDVLNKYNFEIIYAEDLSYSEQVALFREVKYFVGIHGAGLTNLLYSDISSLRVLEIFSASLVHASFYRFLEILGVKHYDAIVGTEFDINWNFTVDETIFEKKIKKLLNI